MATGFFGTFSLWTLPFSITDVKQASEEDLFRACFPGWKNAEIPCCLLDKGEALILREGMSLLAVMPGWVFERWGMTGTKWLG